MRDYLPGQDWRIKAKGYGYAKHKNQSRKFEAHGKVRAFAGRFGLVAVFGDGFAVVIDECFCGVCGVRLLCGEAERVSGVVFQTRTR